MYFRLQKKKKGKKALTNCFHNPQFTHSINIEQDTRDIHKLSRTFLFTYLIRFCREHQAWWIRDPQVSGDIFQLERNNPTNKNYHILLLFKTAPLFPS